MLLRLPVLPFRFEWGRPITRGPGDPEMLFSLGVGTKGSCYDRRADDRGGAGSSCGRALTGLSVEPPASPPALASRAVVGLTIVAMGTSAPELAVSTTAALQGEGAIALGNVVGSNVFLGVVLGICALLQTLEPSSEVWRRDGPFLVGGVAAVWWFVRDGTLERLEAATLVLAMAAYLGWLFTQGKVPPGDADEAESEPPSVTTWLLMAVGLVMILAGGRLLVDGASALALAWGMSPWLISVTIVAAGTSAPELVTSVTAARQGMAGMALGGLVGSDIFNTLLVLGVAGVQRR